MRNLLVVFFLCLGLGSVYASEIIFGHISDQDGEDLPFVNVYIENTSIGTSSNVNGDFQLKCSSSLKGGVLIFQFVGYKSHRIVLGEEHFLTAVDIVLSEESYEFSDIVLVDGDNPADRIMRKLIKQKDNLNNELTNYSNRAYIKSVMKLDSIPEKLPFFLPQDEPIDSSELGILYLSEALSDYYWRAPDDYKEKMIASKVSGESKGVSFNRVSDMDINFYDDYIEIGGISQRPFISPVANQAFGYYNFKLEGVFYESGRTIHKIRVQAKRKNDPCFNGHLFVVDDEWVLHSVDLNLDKPVPMEFADHIHFDQQYIFQDGFWLLFSNNMQIQLGLLGFSVNYDVVNFYSDYVLNIDYSDTFFGNEVFSAKEDVSDKDSSFWNGIRPLALTPIEVSDYVEQDSLERYYKSDVYLDSLDAIRKHVDFMDILYGGVSFRKRKEHRTIDIDGLLGSISFNPVEGLRLGTKISYLKEYDLEESKEKYSLEAQIGYGISDEKLKAKVDFLYIPNRIKPLKFGASLFSDLRTLNDREPLSSLMSTYFSLLEKEHYRKLYRADGVDLSYKDIPLNGLYISSTLSFVHRSSLTNATNYSWKFRDSEYALNNPEEWKNNTMASADIKLVYRHNQKYESNPRYGKRILSNPNPDVYLRFKQGLGMGDNSSNYSLLQFGISEEMDLRMLGTTAWDVKGSSFLNKRNLQYIDKVHFVGNETVLLRGDKRNAYSGSILQSFHLLPFHSRSTDDTFIEAHVSHHFNGFVLNKIPLLRSLKWQLVAGFDALLEEGEKPYQEAHIGIENIFKMIRVDWAVELGENFERNHSILFGVKWNLL